MLTVGGEAPEIYKRLLAEFEQVARQAGKDLSSMPRLIELTVGYSENARAEIAMYMKYWGGATIPALYGQKIYTPAMTQQNGAVVGVETLTRKGCFSTDPDEHTQFLRKYRETGFTHLYLH